jgi:hypothetical protein
MILIISLPGISLPFILFMGGELEAEGRFHPSVNLLTGFDGK